MAEKKLNPLPTSSRKAAKGALMLAVTLLQDERVRAQLSKAPAAAREWAAQRRELVESRESAAARFDPTRRFGQKGVSRRLIALQRNVHLAFPDPNTPEAVAINRAIDELERAVVVSATMPLNERRRARGRISAELRRLELALVDAVLPPQAGPDSGGAADGEESSQT
jgi:hypothetical protein